MSATIQVNGAERALDADTIAALVATLGIPAEARGVAVALNGAVVPRARWAEATLAAGDRVEVIRAMQGG
ncbi:thiamine biosynthesis protein ThiS [Aliidongia dinghuensis]|uniref:Thiamine biosynthesis protein ThiS n=1 Tax=Aliidongia dinghuensis TaxID=1867774 RepID=A0A8J3E0Z5_9PROT|nr:sulfur carrier protein ThiS [Aliidongia dinghuensis]GGF06281.1 thiamine biosynthesis protein ThiS [Aliidongia dinghuensis]